MVTIKNIQFDFEYHIMNLANIYIYIYNGYKMWAMGSNFQMLLRQENKTSLTMHVH